MSRYQRGEFEPEVAHFERERREHIAANQRAQQNAERRHLEALARGHLPESPPIVVNRSAEDEAKACAALEQAKLAARGALLSPKQREAARAAYIASKGPQRPAAPIPATDMHQDDGFAHFKAEMARILSDKPT